MKEKKSFRNTMRSLHRDLGYFVIGLTLIYAITGIILSGRALGWLDQKYVIEKKIESQISKENFKESLLSELKKGDLKNEVHPAILSDAISNIKRFKLEEENDNIFLYKARWHKITYNSINGEVSYSYYSYPPYMKDFIKAHKATHEKAWFYLAIIYSVILSFLAISSMFMLKGKFGFKRRGVYFMLAGFAVVALFLAIG